MTLDQLARLTEPPKTWPQALCRTGMLLACLFPVVLLDKYFGSAVPAAMFGYLWGSLSMYGFMRRQR